MTAGESVGTDDAARYDRVYSLDNDIVRPLGLQLEGLLIPGLLRRQRKVDAGYAIVSRALPRLVEPEGRHASPWN